MNYRRLFLFATPVLLVLPIGALADTSPLQTLSGIPGLENAQANSSDGFAPFINALYNMSIGIGSVIAVFVIIYAGVRISTSDNAGIISELRSRVGMAVAGLVLLLGAYVFLTYINPDLVNFTPAELGLPGTEVKQIQISDVVDKNAGNTESGNTEPLSGTTNQQ